MMESESKKDIKILKTVSLAMAVLMLLLAFIVSVNAEIYSVIGSRDLVTSTDGSYAYMNQNQFFSVYYGNNPASGNVVKIVKDGVDMSLLPMALNWNNDLSQLQQISMPQPVSPSSQGSDVIYPNAYGTGIHLRYETQGDKVKEKIIIDSFSKLPVPASYIIGGGNPVLEVGFQLSTNAQHIQINGADWDKSTEMVTTNDVVIKNDEGKILYTLPRPYAVDDNGVVSYGSYRFKKSSNKLYVRMYFDYSFLQTATYPVVLDPTFIVDYSPTPATHLKDGDVDTDPDSGFTYVIDITSGVSDNSSSTKYEVFKYTYAGSGSFVFYSDNNIETSKVTAIDGNRIEVNHDFSANHYGRIVPTTPFKNGDKITFYVRPKDDDDDNLWVYLTNSLNTVVYGKFQLGDDKDVYEYRYVTLENIPTTITDVYMYNNETQINKAEGDYELITINSVQEDFGQAIEGRFSETYDPLYNWYLALYKETEGSADVYVYAYDNTDDISSQYVIKTLTGTGWFYVNVNSLMSYMDNQSLTYTQFRTFTEYPKNFSEIRLRQEAEDTTPPNITGCQVNTTYLGCLETLKATCQVTDDIAVDEVKFIANGVTYDLIQEGNNWIYYFEPDYDGYDVYDWTNVTAIDLVGNLANIDPDIQVTYNCSYADYINIQHTGTPTVDILNLTSNSVVIYWTTNNPSDSLVEYGLSPSNLNESETNHIYVTEHYITLSGLSEETEYFYSVTSQYNPEQTLTGFNFTTPASCYENWVEDPFTCAINDQYFSTYTDTNACGTFNDLPPTNGTYQYCNYCSEGLYQVIGDCEEDGFQTVDWFDSNALSCCAVTGLISDCSIQYYPYNETTLQSCLYFNNTLGDIECQNIPNINPREKEYCLAHIPNDYLNESFKCISYIKSQLTGEILQTNPEYRERADSFIDWFKDDPETREYFAPANALVNFYYTDKNLKPEENYILTVECSSLERTLSSSMLLEMRYENYEFVFFRTKWLMENAGYVIAGVLVLFIVLALLIWIFRGAFR